MVAPDHRGKGVLLEMLSIWVMHAVQDGYKGLLMRSILSTPAIVATSKRQGSLFIGTIPDSLQTGGVQWADDLVTYQEYGELGLVAEVSETRQITAHYIVSSF